MSTNDTQAAIEAGMILTRPVELTPGVFSVVVPDGSQQRNIDLEKYQPNPRRATGTVTLDTPESFVAYVGKYMDEDTTEVFASKDAARVEAVINSHGSLPGHGDHRAVLSLARSKSWVAWLTWDRRQLPQMDFAEFVEDQMLDIVEPSAADLLELAQTFQAATQVRFESSKRLSSGQVQLTYSEDTKASAGARGQLDIPEHFTIALAPFEGGEVFKVMARLRYRIRQGELTLGFILDRPEEVMDQAFKAITKAIGTDLGITVLAGTAIR